MARNFNELRKAMPLNIKARNEAKLELLYQVKAGPPAAQSYRQYTPEIWPPSRSLRPFSEFRPDYPEDLDQKLDELL